MSRIDPTWWAESRLLGAALREVVDGLPDEGRVLSWGRASPTNEAAVMGLTAGGSGRWARATGCSWSRTPAAMGPALP